MKRKETKSRGVPASRREFISALGLTTAGMIAAKSGAEPAAQSSTALVSLNFSKPGHAIPRTIYGHFIEELGKCIIGGIWRPVPGKDQFLGGVPWDLIQACKLLRPSVIRYPGGCYADSYHWQDGIGPKQNRPTRHNRAWGMWGKEVGPDDTNQFGTDEFILFCRELKAEPMLTVNVGTGTVEEAAAWVEYCNGSPGSNWGAERARNGHKEPFSVKYWCVGNEMWNPIDGGFTAEKYARLYLEFAKAMRAIDPGIKLILSGFTDPANAWNRKVVEIAGKDTDYLSIHSYGPAKLTELEGAWRKRFAYQSVFKVLDDFEKNLNLGISAVQELGPKDRELKVVFDEWNLWFKLLEVVQTNFNLRDGLFVAAMLSRLQRLAAMVPIANLAQMVNCIGIVISDERGTFLTPSAWAFNLYTAYDFGLFLDTEIQSPQIPELEVSATRDQDGKRLSLFLVNKQKSNPIKARISLAGFAPEPDAELALLWNQDPQKYNTFEKPEAVKPELKKFTALPETKSDCFEFSLELPAHSLTAIAMKGKNI